MRLEVSLSKGKEKLGMHLSEERDDKDNEPMDFSSLGSYHVPPTQQISQLNEDDYYYNAILDRWNDGMAWYIREEIASVIIDETYI